MCLAVGGADDESGGREPGGRPGRVMPGAGVGLDDAGGQGCVRAAALPPGGQPPWPRLSSPCSPQVPRPPTPLSPPHRAAVIGDVHLSRTRESGDSDI